jgi:hypothetical protein
VRLDDDVNRPFVARPPARISAGAAAVRGAVELRATKVAGRYVRHHDDDGCEAAAATTTAAAAAAAQQQQHLQQQQQQQSSSDYLVAGSSSPASSPRYLSVAATSSTSTSPRPTSSGTTLVLSGCPSNLVELQVDIADSQQPLNLSKKSPSPSPRPLMQGSACKALSLEA